MYNSLHCARSMPKLEVQLELSWITLKNLLMLVSWGRHLPKYNLSVFPIPKCFNISNSKIYRHFQFQNLPLIFQFVIKMHGCELEPLDSKTTSSRHLCKVKPRTQRVYYESFLPLIHMEKSVSKIFLQNLIFHAHLQWLHPDRGYPPNSINM